MAQLKDRTVICRRILQPPTFPYQMQGHIAMRASITRHPLGWQAEDLIRTTRIKSHLVWIQAWKAQVHLATSQVESCVWPSFRQKETLMLHRASWLSFSLNYVYSGCCKITCPFICEAQNYYIKLSLGAKKWSAQQACTTVLSDQIWSGDLPQRVRTCLLSRQISDLTSSLPSQQRTYSQSSSLIIVMKGLCSARLAPDDRLGLTKTVRAQACSTRLASFPITNLCSLSLYSHNIRLRKVPQSRLKIQF